MSDVVEHAALPFFFALVAALFSSVGQAGGTGYIAILGLSGYGPEVIKPAALALNILVAAIACLRFSRAGLLSWRSFYPFAILGAPFSILGGATDLPLGFYLPSVGVLLLIASALMLRSAARAAIQDREAPAAPPFAKSLLIGAVIGYASGVTGVGGGIYLAPLILALGWSTTRQASGISAVFNLLNSSAALAGAWTNAVMFPPAMPWWLAAVAVGAIVGSWAGAKLLPARVLRYLLAAILFVAALRMIAA